MTSKETYFPDELWSIILLYTLIPKAPQGREKTASLIIEASENIKGATMLKKCIDCDMPLAWYLVFADRLFYSIEDKSNCWICKHCFKDYRIPSIIGY